MVKIYRQLRQTWRFWVIVIAPLLLLPLLLLQDEGGNQRKWKCLYVIGLMGCYWIVEAMPLSVTALLPIVLYPLLGIQPTVEVVKNYMRDTGMLFFGGISLALCIERSGLHRRIALYLMTVIGCGEWQLLLGIMVTTMLLGMWIAGSTAVAAMMIPIVSGLLESLPDQQEAKKNLGVLFMLGTGYAANIGGTSVIIGSTPNLIFRDLIKQENISQGGKYRDINFATWMAFSMPIAIINLLLVWIFLGMLYLQPPRWIERIRTRGRKEKRTTLPDSVDKVTSEQTLAIEEVAKTVKENLANLGKMTWHQSIVGVIFLSAVVLWFTRDPQIFPGWHQWFEVEVTDSTVGIVLVLIMFVIPTHLSVFTRKVDDEWDTLMDWKYLQSKFPWGVLILIGGGFAISDGAEKTGLSTWIGEQLEVLESLHRTLLLLCILIVITCMTEVTSNAATISLLTPILLALAKRLQVHPLYFALPGAIACQYAFVLPTSNPSNALVFTAGNMKMGDMMKPGIFLNFACLSVLYVMSISWGSFVFDFQNYEYPQQNASRSLLTNYSTNTLTL